MKTELVTLHHDLFQPDEIEYISRKSLEVLNDPDSTYRTNFTSWGQIIVKDSAVVLIHDVIDIDVKDIVQRVSKEKITDKKIRFNNIMFYYWSNQSYIPWHDDGHVENACTVYLDREWAPENGGLYQYQDGRQVNTIVPQYNLGVFQHNQTRHATTPTCWGAPWRRSMQWFYGND